MNIQVGSNAIDPAWRVAEHKLIDRTLKGLLNDQPYLSILHNLLDRWLQPREEVSELIGFLPGLVAVRCGAHDDQAVHASAAWRMLRLAAKLLDDVQDGDVGAEAPQILGYSVALIILSRALIADLEQAGVPPSRVGLAAHMWERACLSALAGQHEDLGEAEIDADAWLRIAEGKSGALLGWAAWLGGMVAGLDEARCEALQAYGAALGLALQISDDYRDIWSDPPSVGHVPNDKESLRSNLAIAYARALPNNALDNLLTHSGRSQSISDRASQRAGNVGIANTLKALGAQTFMRSVGHMVYTKGTSALGGAFAPAKAPEELVGVFSHIWPALTTPDSPQEKAP
jgi:hypothetical protein